MHAHIVQHVPFENEGCIASWLKQKEALISYTRIYETPLFPEPDGIDLLIIMGGPMSVNDESDYPWLKEEKQFVRAVIGRRIAVLGICLGAQLIASALGAEVYANNQKEIGWFTVYAEQNELPVFRFPPFSKVFHWHGETFKLPDGAILLASSEACRNQAFQIGSNLVALQFHLETTEETSEQMLEYCSDELVDGEFIQSKAELKNAKADLYKDANALMFKLLDYLTRA